MKKNNLTKIGALLLISTLASVSLVGVGDSMARYITKGGVSDSARVAEFGIDVNVSSMFGAFNDEYFADDETAKSTFSVDSLDEENVLAPGTQGKAFQVTVKGKSEVATKLELALDQISMISLKPGRYENLTTSNQYDLFTLENEYNPVEWVLTDNKTNKNIVSGNLEDVRNYLNQNVNREISAGESVDIDYTLAWQWAFEDESFAQKDAADAYLGKHISQAGNESFDFTATVTQID